MPSGKATREAEEPTTPKRRGHYRKGYTMSKQTAHEFVSNYYDTEEGSETCERKSFIRFRDAMPLGLDAEQIENAYRAFSGKSPRYNKSAASMEPWRAEQYKNDANRIVDVLTHDPTSFTDLYNNAGLNPFDKYNHVAPINDCPSLRKCFKAMAAAGIVGCLEIRTCGKCHIRLYYLND